MSTFFEDMVTSLSEAIAIEKGNVEVKEVHDMPAPTYSSFEAFDFAENFHVSDEK